MALLMSGDFLFKLLGGLGLLGKVQSRLGLAFRFHRVGDLAGGKRFFRGFYRHWRRRRAIPSLPSTAATIAATIATTRRPMAPDRANFRPGAPGAGAVAVPEPDAAAGAGAAAGAAAASGGVTASAGGG